MSDFKKFLLELMSTETLLSVMTDIDFGLLDYGEGGDEFDEMQEFSYAIETEIQRRDKSE